MESTHEAFLIAIANEDVDRIKDLIADGLDLNFPGDEGATVLFAAILDGDVSIVSLLLRHGADPNFVARGDAAFIYADKPLELAQTARFVMDWDRYDPIVKLLEAFGATDTEGRKDFARGNDDVEYRARAWQSTRI